MPDFDKVSAGQTLTIPARTWNEMLDMLAWSKSVRGGISGRPDSGAVRDYNTLLCHSTADVPRYGIVEIRSASQLPNADAPSLEAWQNRQFYVTSSANSSDQYIHAIAQEPITSTRMGRVLLNGVTPAKIDMIAAGDRFATWKSADNTTLVSGPAGFAEILIPTTVGAGPQWGLVNVGHRRLLPASQFYRNSGALTFATGVVLGWGVGTARPGLDLTHPYTLPLTYDNTTGLFTCNGPHRLLISIQAYVITPTPALTAFQTHQTRFPNRIRR